MRIPHGHTFVALLCAAGTVSSAIASSAADAKTHQHVVAPISEVCGDGSALPLGLRRLAGLAARAGEKPMAAGSFSVVDVAANAAEPGNKCAVRTRGGIRFVDIPVEGSWTAGLRGQRPGVSYTTFTVTASLGTIINVDGALISVRQEGEEHLASVEYGKATKQGIEWTPLGYAVAPRPFDGRSFALLPVVTVCADRKAGTWWLSVGDHLVAYDLPLANGKGVASDRTLTITAGKSGAWISELACSDENPVFEDSNNNAVGDVFEREFLGALLSPRASVEARRSLERAWRECNYATPLATHLNVPAPDAISPAERAQAHGKPAMGNPSSLVIDTTLN